MDGPDVAVAWWIFWLAVGIAIFCGLIWTFYRLAVWSDEATWREYLDKRAERDAGAAGRELTPETPDR